MAEAGRFPHAVSVALGNGSVLDVKPLERLVFWQGDVTAHQWPVLKALADDYRYNINLISLGHTDTEARAVMGYPNYEQSHIFLCAKPDQPAIDKLMDIRPDRTLHVFTNAVSDKRVKEVFEQAVSRGLRVALVGEAPLPGNVPLIAKSAEYAMFRMKYGAQIEKVFAVGRNGVEWFKKAGFTDQQVVPWAEFPNEPSQLPSREHPNHTFELFFMGELTSRKAPDVLFEALGYLTQHNWKLHCIGDGHLAPKLLKVAREKGFYDKVEFKNNLGYNEAMVLLSHSDLAVMPSRHESWGPVANEAFMRGVPVVCTDKCGASDLLSDPLRGSVVRAEDPVALAKAIEHWMTIGPVNAGRAAELTAYATMFNGACGALRFHSAFRPAPQLAHSVA